MNKQISPIALYLVMLASVAFAQQTVSGGTTKGDILPAATGQSLGKSTQQWNAFIRDLTIYGNLSGSGNVALTGTTTLSGPLLTGTNSGAQTVTGARTFSGNNVFTGIKTTRKLNNIRTVDGIQFTTVNAAISDCGGNRCSVFIPSNYAGAEPNSVPSTVTLWDMREKSPETTAVKLGDGTPIQIGQREFGVSRTYTNPSGTVGAGVFVTQMQGVSTSPAIYPSAAIDCIDETNGYDNATNSAGALECADFTLSFAGTGNKIGVAQVFNANANGAGTGTIQKGINYYSQSWNSIGAGMTITNWYGFLGEATTKAANNYTFWMDGNGVISDGAVNRVLLTLRRLDADTADFVQGVSSTNAAVKWGVDHNGKGYFSGLTVNTGVTADGSGMKHKRGTAGCATSASIGAVCSTTITWTSAFADGNYTVSCLGNGVTSGAPILQAISSKSAASVGIQTIALTAAAAQFTTIECTAVHD